MAIPLFLDTLVGIGSIRGSPREVLNMSPVFRSKNEVVYDVLCQSIITGELKPGSRFVIDQLAIELGVSQIPIREAMRRLESDGFVTVEPYSGARVTEITTDFIFEVFALLESMEVISSRAACRVMSDEDMEKLARLIEKMDDSVNDPERWSQENKELHLFICELANSSLTQRFMAKMLAHWDRLRLHYLSDVFGQRIQIAQKDHHQILAAFRTRDPEEVEQVIRGHNQRALAAYVKHLQSAGHLEAGKIGWI